MEQSPKLTINGINRHSSFGVKGQKFIFGGEIGDGSLVVINAKTGLPHRVEDMETGLMRLADIAWIEDALEKGELELFGDVAKVAGQRPVCHLDHEAILAQDSYAEARVRVIRALGKAGVGYADPDLSSQVDRVWTPDLADKFGPRPETRTVRSWFERGDPLEVTLADMMSHSGRVQRARRLDPEALEILNEGAHWFYRNRGRKHRDVLAWIIKKSDEADRKRAEAGLPKIDRPSRETVRRRINEILCRELYVEKWGEAAAKAKWDGAGRGLKAVKILALGLMDDTVIDAVTVFDAQRGVPAGRPWLVVLMDVYSRCIVGWCVSFVPPSVHTAAECIRRANRSKVVRADRLARYPVLRCVNGRFGEIITDNGSNYVSPQFGDVLADIGTSLRLAPVRSPRHKAMIERFFRTLKTWLLEKLPGVTLEPALMRKFDMDPEKEAYLTLSELEALIEEFIYVYHISVHSGLNMQPARAWQLSMDQYGRDVIADERKLAILTGVVVLNRRLTRQGLRFKWLIYRDEAVVAALLDDLAGIEPGRSHLASTAVATVKIKYDPQNLGEIHVWNRATNRYVTLPCADTRYATGLSLWQHEQIRAYAARDNLAFNTEDERLAAQNGLNELIADLAPDLKARERRAVARMQGTTAQPSNDFEIVHAEPRHDGLGPIIEHEAAADTRTDGEQRQSRPSKADEPSPHTPDDDPRGTDPDDALELEEDEPLMDSPEDEDRKWEDDYS